MLQFQNCVPIKDFEGFEEDSVVLKSLSRYLISLKNEDNVRAKIAQDFYSSLFPNKVVKSISVGSVSPFHFNGAFSMNNRLVDNHTPPPNHGQRDFLEIKMQSREARTPSPNVPLISKEFMCGQSFNEP
jgi:hypothetical protein